MRKKGILLFILMLFLLLISTACAKTAAEDGQKEELPVENETDTDDNANEPNSEKEEEEDSTKEPDGEEELPEDDVDEEPAVITDEATILGMSEDILNHLTLEEKVGQLFIVNLELLDDTHGNFYEIRKFTKEMKKSLKKYPVGGVAFFARNIETREQTVKLIDKLQGASKIPLFISVDEEGGNVSRIASNPNMHTTMFPSMEEVGQNNDTEYAHDMGAVIGSEIKDLGFNLNFAPVADVKTNERNKEIGDRSFGSDKKLVANMVKAVVTGLQSQGVSATLKHFPGHGDVSEDTHNGAVNTDNDIARLRKIDFVPFKSGIKAGADFIMVSHLSISQIAENTIPASLSELVMKDMLRIELGFKGIIITDAFNMKSITEQYSAEEAAIQAIVSGADIVLMPETLSKTYHGVLEAVRTGEIKEEQIDKSVLRILQTKIRRGLIFEDTDLLPKEEEVVEGSEPVQ